MSISVERINARFEEKIRTIGMIMTKAGLVADLEDELEEVNTKYRLTVLDSLERFYNNEKHAQDDYYIAINSSGIESEIDLFLTKVIDAVKSAGKITAEINKLANDFRLLMIPQPIEKIDPDCCEVCGAKNLKRMDQIEVICDSCGGIQTIRPGVVIETNNTALEPRVKTKQDDSLRHFENWMKRIQATETPNIAPGDIEKIKVYVRRNRLTESSLTINDIRGVLVNTQLTKYNDHASFLMTSLGVAPPPRLNHQEFSRVENLFKRIIKVHEMHIRGKPYYPDMIYRVIDYLYKQDNPNRRLLKYIYLQSRDTIIRNDKKFKEICEILGHTTVTYRSIADDNIYS